MDEPKEKRQRIEAKCPRCNKRIRNIRQSEQKVISTEKDATKISRAVQVKVNIGDVMCKVCLKAICTAEYRNLLMVKTTQQGTSGEPFQSSQSEPVPSCSRQFASDTDSPVSSQPLSQSSTESNPTYKPPKEKEEAEYTTMPFLRTASTHARCCLCSAKTDVTTVPEQARIQTFNVKRVYIPQGNRCCQDHLIKNRFYESELEKIKPVTNECQIPKGELTKFIESLSSAANITTIHQTIGNSSMSDEKVRILTGLSWDNLNNLRQKLTSMRDSEGRNVTQALVTFLFKMRTGNSNEVISAVLGLRGPQYVSDYCDSVLNSFEKDVLPTHFGFAVYTRDFLIQHHTAEIASRLYNLDGLAVICDGTYIYHEKSTNNFYQRKSYSGQKKKPLCKPFTICTTDGFVIDLPGPYYATQNDAEILRTVMSDPNGLPKLLQPGDVFILDRGFRDVKNFLESLGYKVLMPALKGNRKQLTAGESNDSRKTTKVRWPVEAVHGVIKKRFKLLYHQLDNKLLPKVGLYAKIACYLHNEFGQRFNSDVTMVDEIVGQMTSSSCSTNELAEEAQRKRWSQRRTTLTPLKSNELLDFPELTERDLKILFTGTYQLSQTISYLAEIMDEEENINLQFVKKMPNIVQIHVQSRHIKRQMYRVYVKYKPRSSGVSSILGYCCECANGLRTVGCCSHVATVIYYLSHGRYLQKIIKPAEILSKIFEKDEVETVINEDSDDD